MLTLRESPGRTWLASLTAGLLLFGLACQAQTTPNVTVEALGTGAASLLGGDLTDPENDGVDELGAGTDPAKNWNWVGITASHEPDFGGGENSFNIFDNKVGGGNDKWCCDDPVEGAPVWVAVEFAVGYTLTHFTVTSGNDTPTRDPTDWAIQGSNDGETWTDIYHFTDTVVPWNARNQVVKFTLPGASLPPVYKFFRYIAYSTPGTLHQLNEIEFFGIVGTPADADSDGILDFWETQYAACCDLSPSDPTDAAEDCNGNGLSNLDEFKTGRDPCDTAKPTIVSAVSSGTFDTVVLTFSEALDPATATVTANYSISPALAVTAATYKTKVVTLTTAAQTPGGTKYTVTVTGVKDLSNWEVPAGSNTASFFSYMLTKSGVLKFSFWGGIGTTPVQALYDDPRYPATPDWTGAVFSFNSRDILPNDANDNYGATMEGWITPTEAGDYRFFVYSDDASELYLSTDDTEANLTLIAQETACCNNFTEPDSPRTSEPQSLVAGTKYFVRMVYKEGGGGDYGQVAWRKEGNTTPAGSLLPIPGKYLSAAVDLPGPAEGAFTTRTPAPGAVNVSPDTRITIAHRDGKTPWTAENVTLKLNGVAVTPTFVKDGNVATITHKPASMLPGGATQTVTLGYLDPAGQPATLEWSFTTVPYTGPIVDKVQGYPAYLMQAATQTADGGGRSGAAGDRGLDTGVAAGVAYVPDATFLNAATADDKLTVTVWAKLRSVRAASGFWLNSAGSNSGTRGFQAHLPWSNSTIYFDTSGCCGADTQRISANISNFADYTGDATWWQQWHHFTFVKDGPSKVIYINGKWFHEGLGDPLMTDFTTLLMGGGPSITENRLDGILDDFAVYNGGLTEAQALSLAGGAAPSSIAGLVAHWDFNTAPVEPTSVKLMAVRAGSNVTVTSEPAALPAGWVLQTADSITGPWATQTGATTPVTVPIGTGNAFVRAIKP
jgi:hypothetical protein